MISRKFAVRLSAFMAAIALSVYLLTGVGEAHHPEIEATVVCGPAPAMARITVKLTSWNSEEPLRRHNEDVGVTIGTTLLHGKFTAANDYMFTVILDVPANGATVTIHAIALVDWGPNFEFGGVGEAREATVTVPTPCVDPTTTVPSTTAPSTTAPSTTVPSTTVPSTTVPSTTAPSTTVPSTTVPATTVPTTAPTSSVPVTVQGETEERPTSTAPAGASGAGAGSATGAGAASGVRVEGSTETRASTSLARTGVDPRPFLLLAAALILGGLVIETRARRARLDDEG